MKHGLVAILVAAGSVGTAPRARADVERYAVLIGDNRGGADEAALHPGQRRWGQSRLVGDLYERELLETPRRSNELGREGEGGTRCRC